LSVCEFQHDTQIVKNNNNRRVFINKYTSVVYLCKQFVPTDQKSHCQAVGTFMYKTNEWYSFLLSIL